MGRFTKWMGVAAIALLIIGCKKNPLDPDAVDTSVPPPKSANEPAGFTPVANRGFKQLDEDNWIYGGDASAYKPMDATDAPQSRPSIARITLPAGFAAGGTPVNLERNLKPSDHFYLNAFFRVSENWRHNSINDALIALWAGDQPRLFWGWRADSTGAGMYPTALVHTDKVEGGGLWLDPNVATTFTLTPGKWHNVEIEVQSHGGSAAGLGRYVMWIDNVKVASYDNVPFNVIEQNRHWGMLQVGANWGGLTEPLNQSQWLDLDHLYVSAKTL